MVFEKYTFKKYSEDYPLLFKREKLKLKKILGSSAVIEHFGSTAIKGLGGKGIIDIIISVNKKNLKKSNLKLQKAGYVFKPFSGAPERDFFYKKYVYHSKERRVHVHLTFHNSIEIRRAIAFVRYMNKHPEKVKEYVKIKKEGVKFANGDGAKYREYKDKFLKKLSKAALKEFNL